MSLQDMNRHFYTLPKIQREALLFGSLKCLVIEVCKYIKGKDKE